jgi:hypothetical protein
MLEKKRVMQCETKELLQPDGPWAAETGRGGGLQQEMQL